MCLGISVLILYAVAGGRKVRGGRSSLVSKVLFWFLVRVVFVLTLIGARPVELPYVGIGKVFTCFYFIYFSLGPVLVKLRASEV